ncbi:TPA: hypothetical protein LU109_003630 [Enterobacter hormaechei subsp. xiangfangensis]|nr:hypothetical protein [Enterobacter hormaechei subsp. xiangfangensis]
MERLDLMDQLDNLIIDQEAATGLDKLDILDQIEVVMAQLGFTGGAEPTPEPTPEPEPVPEPQPLPDELPDVVKEFKDGGYVGMSGTLFLQMLREIKQYVGGYITLAEVFAGADEWYRKSNYAA